MRDHISMYFLKGAKSYKLIQSSLITSKQHISPDFFKAPTYDVLLKWNEK